MALSRRAMLISAAVAAGAALGCDRDGSGTGASGGGAATGPTTRYGSGGTVGVAFETLQTEAWVFGFEKIKEELRSRGIRMLEAIANNDASRQLEQVHNFIARRVDGIILVPKDADTAMRMIEAANEANIPIVLFNRPPRDPNARCTTIVADNLELTKQTVEYMVTVAKKRGRRLKAAVLNGDLGDINAVGRRDGFDHTVVKYPDVIEVVARIPTEWNQEKARAGISAALQANPDIEFIFTASDFLFPSIVQALKDRGKYRKVNEDGHVIVGGFDGDQTAWQMLADGYLDADGVQDFLFEAQQAVAAILDLKDGKTVPNVIKDPGFVIHQDNMQQMKSRMWGALVAEEKGRKK